MVEVEASRQLRIVFWSHDLVHKNINYSIRFMYVYESVSFDISGLSALFSLSFNNTQNC